MQIHLAKPGGQKEGPFTVERINQGIAAGTIQDADYWAWHDGLAEWLPLHRVLRHLAAAAPAAPAAVAPEQESAPASNRCDISSKQVAATAVSADQRRDWTKQPSGELRGSNAISETDSFTDVFKIAPKLVAETAPVVSSPASVVAKAAVAAARKQDPQPRSSLAAES